MPIQTSFIYERPIAAIAPNHSPILTREDFPRGEIISARGENETSGEVNDEQPYAG